jgi:hypothetical protein
MIQPKLNSTYEGDTTLCVTDLMHIGGNAGAVVEALRYKPESRGIDS